MKTKRFGVAMLAAAMSLLALNGLASADPFDPTKPPGPNNGSDDEDDDSAGDEDDGGREDTHCSTALKPDRGTYVRLNISTQQQQHTNWCWAASVSMVGSFYGANVMQCVLASRKIGAVEPICCAQPDYPGCNNPAWPQENAVGLMAVGQYSRFNQRRLSEMELATEIRNGRPVLIFYVNDQFKGHEVVVDGYTRDEKGAFTFERIDPWTGLRATLSFRQLLSYASPGGPLPWRWSVSRIAPNADGCNTAFDPQCSGSCN